MEWKNPIWTDSLSLLFCSTWWRPWWSWWFYISYIIHYIIIIIWLQYQLYYILCIINIFEQISWVLSAAPLDDDQLLLDSLPLVCLLLVRWVHAFDDDFFIWFGLGMILRSHVIFSLKIGTILARYVIGKWDLESGVEYGWLTSLGRQLIILIWYDLSSSL